jgi:hypothetical protein
MGPFESEYHMLAGTARVLRTVYRKTERNGLTRRAGPGLRRLGPRIEGLPITGATDDALALAWPTRNGCARSSRRRLACRGAGACFDLGAVEAEVGSDCARDHLDERHGSLLFAGSHHGVSLGAGRNVRVRVEEAIQEKRCPEHPCSAEPVSRLEDLQASRHADSVSSPHFHHRGSDGSVGEDVGFP